ncbi:MarR family winged helix-turn-helix transcriptional regulator [Nocardia sp. NPDC088792]|uniref:MarR family winged helix-turn-helix transcriptional regulator n=1 Tax=Nocardia sp. NPDC088792 TaxID=3364332 RepID=UPI0038085170
MNADKSKPEPAPASMDVTPEKWAQLAQGSAAYREYLTAQSVTAHAAAQALGLGGTDFFGLNLIALAGPMTAGELATRTGLTTGAATRLIDRLERSGFVRRTTDPADRRKVVVEEAPDPSGRVQAVLEPHRTRMAEVFVDYTPDQLEVLFDYFARATTALRKAAQDLGERPAG